MSSITKRLLQDLFKSSDGLFIFTIYQRFNVSPKELFLLTKELTDKNLVKEDEGRLTLTAEGKDFVIKTDLTIKSTGNKYDKIPDKFLGRRIEINEFYLPTSQNTGTDILTS